MEEEQEEEDSQDDVLEEDEDLVEESDEPFLFFFGLLEEEVSFRFNVSRIALAFSCFFMYSKILCFPFSAIFFRSVGGQGIGNFLT